MDPTAFDALARGWARGSRRRLLARAAGAVVAAALGRPAPLGAAQGDNCGCGDWTCLRDPDGTFRGCRTGPCAKPDGFYGSCCGDWTCCGGICCHPTLQFCAEPGRCGGACPEGTAECGRTCCPAGQLCENDQCAPAAPTAPSAAAAPAAQRTRGAGRASAARPAPRPKRQGE